MVSMVSVIILHVHLHTCKVNIISFIPPAVVILLLIGVAGFTADHQFAHSPHRHAQRPMGIQIPSQPIMMTTTNSDHAVRRQDSTGAYPSPSTNSSDSSPDLVGSASMGSFDQSPATEEPSDFNSEFPIVIHFLFDNVVKPF